MNIFEFIEQNPLKENQEYCIQFVVDNEIIKDVQISIQSTRSTTFCNSTKNKSKVAYSNR
jgi:hypothetical protein